MAVGIRADEAIEISCSYGERTISFGADNRWVQPDNAFIPTVDSHELRFQTNDFTLAHHAYLPIPIPAIIPPLFGLPSTLSPQLAISQMYLDVAGNGFTGMPSTPCKLLLHGVSAGTIVTVSDPSANVTALNARHPISTSFANPLLVDLQENYMIEVQSPVSGSGAGRFWSIYRVVFQITPSAFFNGSRKYASNYNPSSGELAVLNPPIY